MDTPSLSELARCIMGYWVDVFSAPPVLPNRDAWSRTSNKFWLLAIVSALVRDLLELSQVLPVLLAAPSKGHNLRSSCRMLWASAGFHKALLLDLVKNFADLWIPYTALGHTRLEPGTVGLLGVVSSAAAILPMLDSSFSLSPA